MAIDLNSELGRKEYLKEFETTENDLRKAESLMALEVYNDRAYEYVVKYLKQQYGEKAALEMPIISTINLCKRISNKEASCYKTEPKRSFNGLNEKQSDELLKLYEDSKINQKLFKSNVFFKIQNQNFIQVIPKNNKLEVRCLLPHHLDAVPNEENPEMAEAFIISSYDKSKWLPSDSVNQAIADRDDYKIKKKYYAWTNLNNMAFDEKGKLVGELIDNPIGEVPFIDVHIEKDFEFFVRTGQSLVDFTIQYNGALSDLAQVVKMQGWAQAFMKGDKDLMPKSLTIGPTKIVHLPIDADKPTDTEFGYASANPDVAGSIQHTENLLSNYLTSRGSDPNLVNGKAQASKYNSGMDRLLGMIENFEASKQDYITYQWVEQKLFDLIKKWSQAYAGTDQQFLSFAIPEETTIAVVFAAPEMVQSEMEKLNVAEKKMDLGLASRKMIVKDFHKVDDKEAEKLMSEIDADMPEPEEVNATEKNV